MNPEQMQDLVNALSEQRNQALNALAFAQAEVASLNRGKAILEAELAKLKPKNGIDHAEAQASLP